MVTRITNLQTDTTLADYIKESTSKYNQLALEASSNEKVSKPSDDPNATVNILKTNTSLSKLSSYETNMKNAQSELDTLDETLSSVTDNLSNANDLATQAANGTYNKSDLNNFKTQIDSIFSNVMDLANTEYNGKYIFSGAATSTKTYDISYDASGNISAVTYKGTDTSTDAYERNVNISDGVSVSVNAPGDKVFGSYSTSTAVTTTTTTDVTTTTTTTTTDATGNTMTTITSVVVNGDGTTTTNTQVAKGAIGTLVLLSNALKNSDTTGIGNTLNSFTNSMDNVSAVRTQFASVSNRFELTQNSIDSTVTQLKEYRSNLQDADLTQVLSDLAIQETALKATYQVSSKVFGMSLLNYL